VGARHYFQHLISSALNPAANRTCRHSVLDSENVLSPLKSRTNSRVRRRFSEYKRNHWYETSLISAQDSDMAPFSSRRAARASSEYSSSDEETTISRKYQIRKTFRSIGLEVLTTSLRATSMSLRTIMTNSWSTTTSSSAPTSCLKAI
jgi:hypothetical protein